MRSIAAAVVASLSLMAATARAEQSATMHVSVRVLASAVVEVSSVPRHVVVTDADLGRGYVEVPEPLVVRIRTNSRNGYLLQVANASAAFSRVEVAFGNTTMTVVEEGWVARPYVPGGEVVSARLRVRLAENVTPGRYALPVEVSASPL